MIKRINHIVLVLGIVLAFLGAVFFFEAVRNQVFFITIGLLVLLLLIYWRTADRYDKYDPYLIAFLLVSFIAARLIFRGPDQITIVIRTAATLAFILIHGVLLIGPWSRFSSHIRKLYFYRRHLGVTVILLGSLHVVNVFSTYFNYSVKAALQSIFIFYGYVAFFLLAWLGVTSWDYLQKKVKPLYWKLLHAALLGYYTFVASYVYILQRSLNEPNLQYHLAALIFFFLFWITVAPYGIIKKIMKTYVFGWKQLHVLIYVVYFSLLLHVWLGVISFQNIILKVGFWALAVIVLGSHLAGWIVRVVQDRRIYGAIKKINKQFTDNGKTYIGIDKVKKFKEGKGRKYYVNKQPIAVFKKSDGFIAISNVCAHQKGPIYQGKLVGDSVECPWHYWVYNVKDGSFLGKENFCLPKYDTKVKNGILFVSSEPVNKRKVKHP